MTEIAASCRNNIRASAVGEILKVIFSYLYLCCIQITSSQLFAVWIRHTQIHLLLLHVWPVLSRDTLTGAAVSPLHKSNDLTYVLQVSETEALSNATENRMEKSLPSEGQKWEDIQQGS